MRLGIAVLLMAWASTAGPAFADQGKTREEIADEVDANKLAAWRASDNFRLHMRDTAAKLGDLRYPAECIAYGTHLRNVAADRAFDGDLVMIANADDGPPTFAQRFSASQIYSGAQHFMERAVQDFDRCVAAGGLFKPGGPLGPN